MMRPLTRHMIEQLQLARSKELAKIKSINTPNDFKGTLSGLYRRGFITTRKVILHGKEVEGVYLTPVAIKYLDNLQKI